MSQNDQSSKPALSDLHVADQVLIHDGHLKNYRGMVHEIRDRTAVLRIQGMFRRDTLVEVPLPFIASVDQLWLQMELAKAVLDKDPYGYIAHRIQELRQDGHNFFSCDDITTLDSQITTNWIWFRGDCQVDKVRETGWKVFFCVNTFAVRTQVLLIRRELIPRINSLDNSNIVPAESFKESLTKAGKKQIVNVKTCYRGARYNPRDIWNASQTPKDDWNWYKFRRGHLLPGSVQFQGVPELGVEVQMSGQSGKKIKLKAKTMCYALPLMPVEAFQLVRMGRWGVLSEGMDKLTRRVISPIPLDTPEAREQISEIIGEPG